MCLGGSSQRSQDLDLLAALICAECSVCDHAERVAVGAVAVNRKKAKGRSLESIILAPKQFADLDAPWTSDRCRARSRAAARKAMRGVDPVNGAQFFHVRDICEFRPGLCWHRKTMECNSAVWPTLHEVRSEPDWRHRFYK